MFRYIALVSILMVGCSSESGKSSKPKVVTEETPIPEATSTPVVKVTGPPVVTRPPVVSTPEPTPDRFKLIRDYVRAAIDECSNLHFESYRHPGDIDYHEVSLWNLSTGELFAVNFDDEPTVGELASSIASTCDTPEPTVEPTASPSPAPSPNSTPGIHIEAEDVFDYSTVNIIDSTEIVIDHTIIGLPTFEIDFDPTVYARYFVVRYDSLSSERPSLRFMYAAFQGDMTFEYTDGMETRCFDLLESWGYDDVTSSMQFRDPLYLRMYPENFPEGDPYYQISFDYFQLWSEDGLPSEIADECVLLDNIDPRPFDVATPTPEPTAL